MLTPTTVPVPPAFTLAQIKAAHAKVKSGADFPKYVQDLKALGVTAYTIFVADGRTDYAGAAGTSLAAPAGWPTRAGAPAADVAGLRHALQIHQLGQSDYATFCQQAAAAGVEKWTVDMLALTCTYYDRAGQSMVVEIIPTP